MPKETLIAIGAGVLSAFAATAFLSRAPGALMLVYFADLPLFMAGFGLGPQAMVISSAVGFMATGLIGGGIAAGIFGMTQALPAWLVVRQYLLQRSLGSPRAADAADTGGGAVEWFPVGDILCWLTMLAAAALVAGTVASLSSGEGLSVMVSTNLENLLQAMTIFEQEGFTAFHEEWNRCNLYRGRQVVIHRGEERIDGTDIGVDVNGNLLLETVDGVRVFNAGEVSLRARG